MATITPSVKTHARVYFNPQPFTVKACMAHDRNRLVVCKNLILLKETDQAILVGPSDARRHTSIGQAWIPYSLVAHTTFDGENSVGEIEIPWWVADKNELEFSE